MKKFLRSKNVNRQLTFCSFLFDTLYAASEYRYKKEVLKKQKESEPTVMLDDKCDVIRKDNV